MLRFAAFPEAKPIRYKAGADVEFGRCFMALVSETRGSTQATGPAVVPPGTARVRLGTLNNLRWLAVAGQAVAVVIVGLGFKFDLPLIAAATTIGLSALLNVFLSAAFPSTKR